MTKWHSLPANVQTCHGHQAHENEKINVPEAHFTLAHSLEESVSEIFRISISKGIKHKI
jgi:hypothetical protein